MGWYRFQEPKCMNRLRFRGLSRHWQWFLRSGVNWPRQNSVEIFHTSNTTYYGYHWWQPLFQDIALWYSELKRINTFSHVWLTSRQRRSTNPARQRIRGVVRTETKKWTFMFLKENYFGFMQGAYYPRVSLLSPSFVFQSGLGLEAPNRRRMRKTRIAT